MKNQLTIASNHQSFVIFAILGFILNANVLDFQHIKACTNTCFCFKCVTDAFPFGALNIYNFSSFVHNKKNSNTNTARFINLKPPQISVYYLTNSIICHQIQSIKIQKTWWTIVSTMALMTYKKLNQTKLCLSLFHLNTCSLKKKFDELEYLIKTTNQTFDVINISEYRIKVILILQLTLTCQTI